MTLSFEIEFANLSSMNKRNKILDALHSEYSNAFQDFFEQNRDIFFSSCHWTDTFEFRVIYKNGIVIDASSGDAVA